MEVLSREGPPEAESTLNSDNRGAVGALIQMFGEQMRRNVTTFPVFPRLEKTPRHLDLDLLEPH